MQYTFNQSHIFVVVVVVVQIKVESIQEISDSMKLLFSVFWDLFKYTSVWCPIIGYKNEDFQVCMLIIANLIWT